jgi:hypothetical protein
MNDKIKLKDACKILNGFAFKSGKYVDSGIRIIRIANVQKGYVEDERPVFYPNSEESSIRDYMLEEDDLLLSLTGNVGRVALLDKRWLPAALNQRVACLRIKDDRIIKDYLYFALLSDKFENDCTESSKGIAQKNMSTEWLKDYEIPLPSGQKQREIISSLKQLSMIIKNKTEQIQQLDDLIKARFVEMFGGIDLAPQNKEWTKISDIGEVVSGSTPKTSIKEYWNGNICWITPAELSNMSGIIYDSKKKITERGKSSCSLRMMPSRTVILSSRAPIGKVALLGKEMCCNQGFKNIICNEKVAPEYLYYLLGYNTIFLNSLGRGATFKEISKKIVGEIKVPLPAKELQNQFAVFTRQVDKSKFAVQKSLEKTQLLFDSLMQEYFG